MKRILILMVTITSGVCFAQNVNLGEGSGTGGSLNTHIGVNTGQISTGMRNVFFGYYAGNGNTTGKDNSFFGAYSGQKNTTGNFNMYIGRNAGREGTTSAYNTAIGVNALILNKTGSNNLSIGTNSGYNALGSNNTFIGTSAGFNSKGSGNVFIGSGAGYNVSTASNLLYIENSSGDTPLIYGDFSANKVGINTNEVPNGYALGVRGKIIAEEIKVKLGTWPDYVFDKRYSLMPLNQIETYIKSNGHLPNIPSEKEVMDNGIELGEMNAKLLEKIEELTLHTIEQDKMIKELIQMVKVQDNRIQQMENQWQHASK